MHRRGKGSRVTALQLDTPIQYVSGVGPTRAEQLSALGMETVEDVLMYFPRRFDLRRQVQPMGSLRGNEANATVAGEVTYVNYKGYGRRPYFEATLMDPTGAFVGVKWFNGGYLQGRIRPGMHIAVNGKVSMYREAVQFVNPSYQVIWAPEETNLDEDELLPVYPAGAKLTSGHIGQIIRRVLPEARSLIREWFPPDYLEKRGLMPRPDAVAAMHRPEDQDQWKRARRRMAYDECFLMQLGMALMRMREVSRPAWPLRCTPAIDKRIRARFPFPLTDAQNRAVEEIVSDLAAEKPMNRLLQGDVGSGKTVVALYAALTAVANRKQVSIMAPTEILARQHYAKIVDYLEGSRVRIELLVGGMKATERKRILNGLAEGTIDIVVGTHALISEGVRFANLALTIVDEQHKFGVQQRTSMRGKGFAPHYLVMTATPIPRTLAMTVFGDLDVSVIDELPPGRGTTETRCATMNELDKIYGFVRGLLDAGQQAYFIYPLVTASADSDMTAAEDAYHQLDSGPFADYGVGMIHGQMKTDRKNAVMAGFRDGSVQVLVASVVVEVGVDVPSANAMVILHAERFGLAQLHQLRGRIGRGRDDAHCILVAEPGNEIARRRLDVLTETHDGFKVAEEDLRIRGPGEFFGTRQHGLPELKVADLIEDFELLRLARRDAFHMVAGDPDLSQPAHQTLRREVLKVYGRRLGLLAGA
ncbi:MAG: ATP-dependent DNA helicase RecG [Planctomycetota bacterium]